MSSSATHLRRVHGEEGESTDGTGTIGLEPGLEAVLVEEMAAREKEREG